MAQEPAYSRKKSIARNTSEAEYVQLKLLAIGKWILESSDKYDEYLKAVGAPKSPSRPSPTPSPTHAHAAGAATLSRAASAASAALAAAHSAHAAHASNTALAKTSANASQAALAAAASVASRTAPPAPAPSLVAAPQESLTSARKRAESVHGKVMELSKAKHASVSHSNRPTVTIATKNDEWLIYTDIKNVTKSHIKFKIGKEFDEHTIEGRQVKTTVTVEGDTRLRFDQKANVNSVVTWDFTEDHLTIQVRIRAATRAVTPPANSITAPIKGRHRG